MGRLKEALNVSDFKRSDPIGFPDGAQEHGFGNVLEELEELIGDVLEVLAILPCLI